MLTTSVKAKRRVHFDDLLDIAPANDRDGGSTPKLRSLSQWTMRGEINAESEDALYAGLSYDVAEGGIFIATFTPPPIGARVDLTVKLPEGNEVEASGVVRWVRDAVLASDGLPAGCGIEWKGLPLDALRALERFTASHEPVLWLADAA